jgi:hypothetical protein
VREEIDLVVLIFLICLTAQRGADRYASGLVTLSPKAREC